MPGSFLLGEGLVDQSNDEVGLDQTGAPFGIEIGGRLGGNGFVERFAGFFGGGDAIADSGKHVVGGSQVRLVAERTVSGDDFG